MGANVNFQNNSENFQNKLEKKSNLIEIIEVFLTNHNNSIKEKMILKERDYYRFFLFNFFRNSLSSEPLNVLRYP